MKKNFFTALLMGVAAIAAPVMAVSQNVVPDKPIYVGGVGPVVSGSTPVEMIPLNGIRFIVENYPAAGIVSMDKEYASNSYDVKLNNGTELEFNSKGDLIEIEAADNTNIPEDVVKAILPDKAYNLLENDGLTSCVESISMVNNGYKIDFNIPEDVEYFYSVEEEIITPA